MPLRVSVSVFWLVSEVQVARPRSGDLWSMIKDEFLLHGADRPVDDDQDAAAAGAGRHALTGDKVTVDTPVARFSRIFRICFSLSPMRRRSGLC